MPFTDVGAVAVTKLRSRLLLSMLLGCSDLRASNDAGLPFDAANVGDAGVDVADVDGSRPADSRLCNGTDALRFTYALVGGGQTDPGQDLLAQNGWSFLYVDGRCRFWISGPQLGHPAVSGVLDEGSEHQFSSELRYADLGRSLVGNHAGPLHDSLTSVLTGPGGSVACDGDCDWVGAPADISGVIAALLRWLPKLRAAGAPITGPVRMFVKDPFNYTPAYPNGPASPWPLSQPIESYIRDYIKEPGNVGSLVQAPDADLLRAMRQKAIEGAFDPLDFREAVPVRVEANGPRLQMFMRDVLSPLEDLTSGKVVGAVR